ncbi:diacylglycerol kinase family enzyme [Larkinella arboricola]|uniref:Diacylglycerol kinase family enzyme n=1 Tax=Larkinella arboricola TaxID=643671 RepID=A0A327WZY8_LARAB|nr:diacylglycerol kinase family protein [Larkinella arboricola]RAJ97925.1 diacylglycerol kinase family enzyme [Larkinella arboricola]
MKIAQLLHNPGAGDEDHSKKGLMDLIKSEGFDCRYASTEKRDWKELRSDVDFLVVAGGDGTVRRVAKHLLNRKLIEKPYPIALLPSGTANNIAGALRIPVDRPEAVVRSWKADWRKRFDVGLVEGLPKPQFFLESIGYGVFPQLMNEMEDQQEKSTDAPEEKMKVALDVLAGIVQSYEARSCQIEVDGVDHSGNYLLVEVMNTRSIGPNLGLAPAADPGDGQFDIVLVSESQRMGLITYVQNRLKGIEGDFWGTALKGRTVRAKWDGIEMHLDDQLVSTKKPRDIRVMMHEGALSFLGVPD